MSRFLSEKYQPLEAYTPGEQPRDMRYVKLNTNESPYPPAPGVAEAAVKEASRAQLYSDPVCTDLRDALARRYGFARENIFVSNGSDDILNFAFMAFAGSGVPAVFPEISYGFYPVYAALHGVEARPVPLKDDFSIDPADYENAGGFIAIANPNAPTGMALTREQVCVPLVEKYENLLVVMTFSKSRGLAGARLGFAIAQPGLIADLEKIKYSTNPYSVNRMTLAAGIASLARDDYNADSCRRVIATREASVKRLEALGFEVLPSQANFVFARKPGTDGGFLYRELKKSGVLVRHFDNPRIADFLRITIGTDMEMDVLFTKLREILISEE